MLNKHITTDNLKTILPPIQHAIDKLDKKVGKPDWSENDPNASGYIKNRPFYEEFTLVPVIQNTTFEGNSLSHYSYFLPLFPFMEDPSVFQETTFIVNFDGIDYEHKGKVVASDQGYIGNGKLSYDTLPYTGEPFCIFIYGPYAWINTNSTANMHTFSVKAFVPEVVKIDEKYLPELVGIKGTGENAEVFNGNGPEAASGMRSHAEGYDTLASGTYSHAEGLSTIASSYVSHAEGAYTTASGKYSHAEGSGTTASGSFSHAEGIDTVAASKCQHVQGRNNIVDADNKYLHIVGNGADATNGQSNAHTLDWDGNAWFAGTIKIGGVGQDDNAAVEVATKTDLSAAKSAILLTDQVNGYNYIIFMQNGSLTSRCAIKSIAVTTMPTKITYYAGDYIDLTGMTVIATAYDGTTKDITDSVDLTGYLSEGDTAIEIVYVEAGITHTTTIPVTVNAFDPATVLVDFTYTSNNGTYTITGWKQTLNGVSSTEMVIPNNAFIVV